MFNHKIESKKTVRVLDVLRAARIDTPRSLMWVVAIMAVLINLGILLVYQYKLGVDFPFQDEWGYVDRLVQLKSIGFIHYLFNVYQVYFIPGTLAIWYAFYHYFDLDIMYIRYTGAVVSASAGFFICFLMIQSKSKHNSFDLFLMALAPFVICSLNLWATYNQSIESIIEPLLFSCVLVACWAGREIMNQELGKWGVVCWFMVTLIAALLAVSMYVPGLSVLIAIAVARILLLRKIDLTTVLFGLLGLGGGILYIQLGAGAGGHIPLDTIHIMDVMNEWVILIGNSLLTQPVHSPLSWVVGVVLIFFLLISIILFLFISDERRPMFFIPLALSIYTFGVSLEIVWAYHSPEFGRAPRYAVHMIGAPVAALMWVPLYLESRKFRLASVATTGIILISVLLAALSTARMLPYFRANFDKIRVELFAVNAPISDKQVKSIQVGEPLRQMVYPDLQFLQRNRLSLYRNSGE